MSSEKKQSKGFMAWYASPQGKRVVGIFYSVGAAVVIIGALFKIMHWPGAAILLTAGMLTEALLFTIGVFDKPHPEYHWDKIFDFEGGKLSFDALGGGSPAMPAAPASATVPQQKGASLENALSDSDIAGFSSGIKSLSETALQLTSLSEVVGVAKEFAKNMESAAELTSRYSDVQQALNKATGSLLSSYETLNADMDHVVGGTKEYAGKVGDINKNLASLNAVYEIQMKNLQMQSEAVASQLETTRLITENLNGTAMENKKIQQLVTETGEEAGRYKMAVSQLNGQIAELNKVYGNMLNALS